MEAGRNAEYGMKRTDVTSVKMADSYGCRLFTSRGTVTVIRMKRNIMNAPSAHVSVVNVNKVKLLVKMSKRRLTEEEIQFALVEDDDDYEPSDADSDGTNNSSSDESQDDTVTEEEDLEAPTSPENDSYRRMEYVWTKDTTNFVPKHDIPDKHDCIVTMSVTRASSELEIFLRLFPKSLFLQIAHYTNERLDILAEKKKKNIQHTCLSELMVIFGCTLVMSYNRVPAMRMYWSRESSLRNEKISESISRDRFQLGFSKLYFNNPCKPAESSKIFYVEDVVRCLKKTFLAARTDSTFQSIDESMTKFKGRSSMKQYLPMKPVKRGIKTWVRSDSNTGYVYDFNIYQGKETQVMEGTLGERVIKMFSETIRAPEVCLYFDRFFTSVRLMSSLPFAAVGTCMPNRKNLPKLDVKLQRGESEMYVCNEGILVVSWQDTKFVTILSNCHNTEIGVTQRKIKDGTKKDLQCPEAFIFYNDHMGGVDLGDQMITLYDLDRKSKKWWIKVFFRLLMTAVYNAHVIHNEINHKKRPFIDFLVTLAESLIEEGRENLPQRRVRSLGRPSKTSKELKNVDHMPVHEESCRRCIRCS
ncbi:piggyBac transposable element-derived protein 4-like [Palaemon carinicauda]|uniref:piggyBac transposable element-derived protein 4-like n=1 Tax=Palaemon carinicauda TaxID=392227 RepID=UPI0035B68604